MPVDHKPLPVVNWSSPLLEVRKVLVAARVRIECAANKYLCDAIGMLDFTGINSDRWLPYAMKQDISSAIDPAFDLTHYLGLPSYGNSDGAMREIRLKWIDEMIARIDSELNISEM